MIVSEHITTFGGDVTYYGTPSERRQSAEELEDWHYIRALDSQERRARHRQLGLRPVKKRKVSKRGWVPLPEIPPEWKNQFSIGSGRVVEYGLCGWDRSFPTVPFSEMALIPRVGNVALVGLYARR